MRRIFPLIVLLSHPTILLVTPILSLMVNPATSTISTLVLTGGHILLLAMLALLVPSLLKPPGSTMPSSCLVLVSPSAPK